MTQDKIVETFLRESNAIEGVYDRRSLDDAIKAWEYLAKQPELTTTVILTTHKLLMVHQDLENIQKGHYRKCKVWIGRHEALSHLRITEHMNRWIICMNAEDSHRDWKRLHVEYEQIHPFVDGNGRTGRMFMNWHRLHNGESIYVVKQVDRQKYYKWFAV